jgi:hypothetical protein
VPRFRTCAVDVEIPQKACFLPEKIEIDEANRVSMRLVQSQLRVALASLVKLRVLAVP